jgi:hypothetical protein
MDLIKSEIQDISPLNTSDKLKEYLNSGIEYIFSTVTKLQKKSPGDKYEIDGYVLN